MSPDLSTKYLGLPLQHPVVASAGPLTGNVESLQQLEQSGIAAVVLPSLFEEQIEHEELAVSRLHEYGTQSFAEALDYFPQLATHNVGPDGYLKLIEDAKQHLSVPVIGSLNGSSLGGWVRYAERIQAAGADALELNVYFVPTDPDFSGAAVEDRYCELVAAVRAAVSLPLAVKVGPGFSSPANMARRLVEAGADGLVLFNRFLRPDIDLESMKLVPSLVLSDDYASRIPLQWIAILRGRVPGSLAATGGVHAPDELVKMVLAGADAVMTTSALLRHGPERVRTLVEGLQQWMEEREYDSVEQMKGSMSYENCPNPRGYERQNYMRALVSWTGTAV